MVYVFDDDFSGAKPWYVWCVPQATGFQTFTAAIAFLKAGKLEALACLVLDLDIPGLNGLEFREGLADKEISLPVAFITGYGTVPDGVRARKAGAVNFLQKRFNDEGLLEAIFRPLETDHPAKQDQGAAETLRGRAKTLRPGENVVFRLGVAC